MLSIQLREKAFAMYCAGIPPNKVATLLGLRDSTVIYKWRDRFGWEEKQKEVLRFKEENSKLSDQEQDLKIVESVLSLYAMKVKDKKDQVIDELKIKDVMEAVKLRRLLKGETTENISISNEVSQVKEEINKLLEKDNE